MIEFSENIADLSAALAKAQANIEGAIKNKQNPHFRSTYADLAGVWEACREALTANGLSVVQSPGAVANGTMTMTTMLLHASGQWMRGSLTIPLGNKLDAQAYGSATTYARRYALAAFVGVAQEDDDGNAAAKAKPEKRDLTHHPMGEDFPGCEDKPVASSYAAKKNGMGELFQQFQTEISELATTSEIGAFIRDRTAQIQEMPAAWRKILREKLDEQKHEISRLSGATEDAA